MIELKITGENAKEFFQNAAHAFMLLAHGGNTVFAKPNAPVSADAPGAASVSAEPTVAVAEPNPPVVEKPKRGRKPAAALTIDATEGEKTKPLPQVDEDPLGLNDVKTAPATEHTLDDMRDRVKAIIDAGTARGATMPENVAYVRKLFAPFGIKLAADLKPEQFAEFIAASAPYLDGTAK